MEFCRVAGSELKVWIQNFELSIGFSSSGFRVFEAWSKSLQSTRLLKKDGPLSHRGVSKNA